MNGITQLPVGSFKLSDYLKLNVRASDDGTIITITQAMSGKTTRAVIDEHGCVVARCEGSTRAERISSATESITPAPPPTRQFTIVSVPDNMAAPKRKLIRFTLRYTPKARPQNRPQALCAFSDGSSLHVVYRIQSGKHIHDEGQLRCQGDDVTIANRVSDEEKLPRDRWNSFLTMPADMTFRLGSSPTLWRKLTTAEIEEQVKDRIFVVSPINRDAPVAAPQGGRPLFKSKGISVLSCEAVNFDHDEGEPAVAVATERSGTVEPLVVTMDDARRLVSQMLVALWTNDDEFAEEVLAAKFPHDDSGRYIWPKPA